jgi:hypothetical protein
MLLPLRVLEEKQSRVCSMAPQDCRAMVLRNDELDTIVRALCKLAGCEVPT